MTLWKRFVLTALLVAGGVVLLRASEEPSASTGRSDLKRVRVAPVETGSDARRLRFAGATRAARRARLAFVLGGRLLERPVETGDRVKEGQILARLDDLELRNAVASARGAHAELVARTAQAERELDRARRLADAKAATAEEVERSSAAVEALQASEEAAAARLREAERRLDEALLRAPFAGTVTEVLAEPGEYAVAGKPLVVLSGDGDLEIEVEVPESVIRQVRDAAAVVVTLPVLTGPGADLLQVDGRITSVGRTAGGAGRLFPVIAKITGGEDLAPGMTAELVLSLSSDGSLTVPVEAVVDPGGQRPAVYRVVDGDGGARVEKLGVEVGSFLGERVIVYGPLAAGDRVVVGGQRGLLDGQSVEIQ